jgi:hypothetical protein
MLLFWRQGMMPADINMVVNTPLYRLFGLSVLCGRMMLPVVLWPLTGFMD